MDWLHVLGDKNTLRILMELDDGTPMTLYSVSRRTGAYPRTTRMRLRLLVKSGLVTEERLGGAQTYRLNRNALPEEVRSFLAWLKAHTFEGQVTSR